MRIYINGCASITSKITSVEANSSSGSKIEKELPADIPDINYADYIEPKLLRRMSKIIKMSVATAKIALRRAEVELPGAILVGTGLGCMTDTERFLTDLCVSKEGTLSPTAFIQSTHNTIAGQIGLLLNCYAYNSTYSDRNHSFEQALLDARLHLYEGNNDILVGSADECTEIVRKTADTIHGNNEINRNGKYSSGEGSSFFVLSTTKRSDSCELKGINILPRISRSEIPDKVTRFLANNGLSSRSIDLIILGDRPDSNDGYYSSLKNVFEKSVPSVLYKEACGEYFTSSAFALATGVSILNSQTMPEQTLNSGKVTKEISNILIYHHYKSDKHSFSLISK